MTEVNKTPHKTVLSDLFIFLSINMISHEEVLPIASNANPKRSFPANEDCACD
jgi:hypothetical protein